MKVLILYTNENDKTLYEKLILSVGAISSLFININESKNNSLFEYIKIAEKIVVFFDKDYFTKNAYNQLEIFDYLFKHKHKTVVISNEVLPYAIDRKILKKFCYNIKNKNDFSTIKKLLVNFLNGNENNQIINDDKTKNKNNFFHQINLNKIFIYINTIIIFLSCILGVSFESGIHNNLVVYRVSWIVLIISILNICYYLYLKLKSSSKEVDNYIKKAADIFASSDFIDKNDTKNNNALGRMLLNLDALQEYYSWSKSQSKMSFYLAIFLIFFGILIIASAVWVQIVFKVSITISIVISLSGTIVEFIAGTALVVYKNSLTQLNHYHRVLHEDERFLSSLNIVNNLSNDKDKDDMIKELIRSEIELNRLELIQTNYNNKNVKN